MAQHGAARLMVVCGLALGLSACGQSNQGSDNSAGASAGAGNQPPSSGQSGSQPQSGAQVGEAGKDAGQGIGRAGKSFGKAMGDLGKSVVSGSPEKMKEAGAKTGSASADLGKSVAGGSANVGVASADTATDAGITAAINSRLKAEMPVDGIKVSALTNAGVVTLKGSVPTTAARTKAEHIAKQYLGRQERHQSTGREVMSEVRALLATLLFLCAAWPQAPAASQARPRTLKLVVLLAHADDETAASPVLARYAREGVRVYLIIASDGSGGSGSQTYLQRPDSGPTGDALVKARAEEARCAAAGLGAEEPVLLGFPDGKLGDYLGDRALLPRLTERIAQEIERLRPDAVVTWGPDGGTGHPDHRLVSNIATQLLRAGAPGVPDRLFYMYLPVEMFRLANPQRGEPPMLIPQAKYFTVQVPFQPVDLEAAKRSMACHHSQFTPEMLQGLLPKLEGIWNGKIMFVPGSSATSRTDLFR